MIGGAARRGFRAYQVPVSETAFRPVERRPADIRPIRYTFPPCDTDWCSRNLPIVRAAAGIVGQDGAALIGVHREAIRTNPAYASEMVADLNERIAHFETLIRVMRLARYRIEAAATLADAIEPEA